MPVFAGSPAREAVAPAPQSSLWSWFIGGSVGYLADAQEVMYNGHIGVNTPWTVGGWNVALFGEVGYSDIKDSYVNGFYVDTKTEIVPITFNVKFERPIMDKLSVYVGAGLGAAVVDVSASSSVLIGNYSHNSTVFTSQIFAGLDYKFCPSFDMYAGARWIYLNDVKIANTNYNFNNNDCLFEVGARITF